jgi:hypothetical protein
MRPSRDDPMRNWWHFLWAAIIGGALLLNVFWPVYPGYSVWALSLVAFPPAAAVILANRPGNRVGRVLAVVAMSSGWIFIGGWGVWTWLDQDWTSFVEAGLGVAVPVLFWGAITLVYIFPTGIIVGRFTRGVYVGFSVIISLMALLAVLEPGPMPLTGRNNPMGGPSWIEALFDAGITVLIPGLVVGFWSFIARYRSASPEVRSQMKWFLAGLVAVAGLVIVVGFIPEQLPSPYEELTLVVVVAGFWALPASIVVAITRYRLYEIDRLVSRTLTYSIVVSCLAGVFALSVVGLQTVLPDGSSNLAVAASTLAMAALFNPLRRKVQAGVDRRFNRSKYSAEEVVALVSERVRHSVNPDEVVSIATAVITEVFAPNGLAAWVSDRKPAVRI